MEKEFILYEQALALKELGFDEPCFGYYDGNHNLQFMYNGIPEKFSEKMMGVSDSVWVGWISAPTLSQAFRWFREKVGYFQLFDYQHGDSKINRGFFFNIINIDNEDFFFPEDFENQIYKTYEEAELECLKKLIEIKKNK